MLDKLPPNGVDERLVKNWNDYGPLTVKQFEDAARKYGLPRPVFNAAVTGCYIAKKGCADNMIDYGMCREG